MGNWESCIATALGRSGKNPPQMGFALKLNYSPVEDERPLRSRCHRVGVCQGDAFDLCEGICFPRLGPHSFCTMTHPWVRVSSARVLTAWGSQARDVFTRLRCTRALSCVLRPSSSPVQRLCALGYVFSGKTVN